MSEERTYPQRRFERPEGACELLLVRHGESEPAHPDRPFPLVDGHGDPALSPEGREQAVRVADRLATEPISAMYVTTLRRTHETAAPLAARLGITPVVEADLREVHLGEWEGGSFRRHVAEGHPAAQRMYAEGRWDVIPGAEPAEHFAARVRSGIERIAAAHRNETVVVVAHGGTIGQVLVDASGASNGFAFVGSDNGAISHIVVTPDRWVIRRFNDTGHLSPTFSSAARPPT
jgi:2,3-bisphosphoglycerate-dependent phosphoglycerate mutase